MVRATAAEVEYLFMGNWPPGVDDTSAGNILAGVDYLLDGYVKRNYKTTLSTTDTDVVHIANLLAKQVILQGLWSVAGGVLSDKPEPALFTAEIKMLIEAVLTDVDKDGFGHFALQE